ncbi:unnamed protein product [Ranitomeya imitator]|uniref:Uncharacterized protein n=1 Tax=Ranitomeya imitator TaxID=111125 RepID=A0ABN9MRJ8_9NEOB|nr:unnamed protein product [Ranitomeya imitator]
MLQGHSQDVTSVTWSPTDFTKKSSTKKNKEKIVTCSDDNTIRIWRLKRGGSSGTEEETMNRVGWTCPKKVEFPCTGPVHRTPAKSHKIQNPLVMTSPTPATCASSYAGDLPISSSTPTSPFLPLPRLHTPPKQKEQPSPQQQSMSKLTITKWVTRTH